MVKITLGGNEYDSFESVEGANIYLMADVARAASWALRQNEAKGRGLISATRMIVGLPWCDTVPGYDDAPPVVSEVTAMLASDLLTKPKLFLDASGNSNVKIAKAGSATVEFFSPVVGGPAIPRSLWDKLFNAGLVCLGGNTSDPTLEGAWVSGINDGCRPLGGRYPWDWPIASEDYD